MTLVTIFEGADERQILKYNSVRNKVTCISFVVVSFLINFYTDHLSFVSVFVYQNFLQLRIALRIKEFEILSSIKLVCPTISIRNEKSTIPILNFLLTLHEIKIKWNLNLIRCLPIKSTVSFVNRSTENADLLHRFT